MTIPASELGITRHTGNGVAFVFDYGFKITHKNDLLVRVESTTGSVVTYTVDVDYTVSGVGDDGGGSITLTAGALTSGYVIAIEDNIAVSQTTPYKNQASFLGSRHENSFDKLTRMVRKSRETLDRCIRVASTVSPFTPELPLPESGKILRWKETEDGIENASVQQISNTLATSNWVVDNFVSGTDYTQNVTTQLTLSQDPGLKRNTWVFFDGVPQHQTTYSLTGSVITFNTVIPYGVLAIEVRSNQALDQSYISDSSAVNHTPSGGVATTVKAKLNENVSVLDKGSTPADIQAQIDELNVAGGGKMYFPPDSYALGTTSINLKDKVLLVGGSPPRFGNDSSASGEAASEFVYTGSGYAINLGDTTYNCSGGGLLNLGVQGSASGAGGVRIAGVTGGACVGNSLQNVTINNFTGSGLYCGPFAFIGDFWRVDARNCGTGINLNAENNRYNLSSCDMNQCTTGLRIGGGSGTLQTGISLFGGRIENTTDAVIIDAPTRTVGLYGTYIESFSTDGIRTVNSATLSVIGCDLEGTAPTGQHINITNGGFLTITGNSFNGSTLNEINLGATAVFGEIKGNRHNSAVTGSRITAVPSGSGIEMIQSFAGQAGTHNIHEFLRSSFTPTWGNVTLGDGTSNGFYNRVGDYVFVSAALTIGATTSITGAVTITNLPYTSSNLFLSASDVRLLDTGPFNYTGRAWVAPNSNTVVINADDCSGSYVTAVAVDATTPFTWAAGDQINVNLVYVV